MEATLTKTTYPCAKTALLFVDPYHDFLSEGGKVYPRLKPIAAAIFTREVRAGFKSLRQSI